MTEAANTAIRIDRADLRAPAHSQWYLAWRQFRRHKVALVSALVLLILFFLVFLAPFLAPYRYDAIDMRSIRKPPTAKHLMGTDDIGRDLFTRVLYGGRISLAIGLFAAFVSTLAGAVIGALSGYYGGPVDSVLMRFTDIVLSMPILPILIILASYARSSIPVMIIVIGLLSWMPTARVVRGTVLSIRTQDYITAAHMIGDNDSGIIVRHILPNSMAPIIVGATLTVGGAIILESSLSFLGLGVQQPTPSWGNMLQDAQTNMGNAPWLAIFPGLAILITVLCVNFLGDGLRDALDPTQRR